MITLSEGGTPEVKNPDAGLGAVNCPLLACVSCDTKHRIFALPFEVALFSVRQ